MVIIVFVKLNCEIAAIRAKSVGLGTMANAIH